MLIDSLVSFQPLGAPLPLVGGAGETFASANVYDLIGQGVGQPPRNIIGNAATFGTDQGVGGKRPELNITVGDAFTGAAGTTLKVALQAAPDTGAGGGFQPGAWQDVISQDNIPLADLVAGAVIFRAPWVPVMPANLNPRYLRLLFIPQAAGETPGGNFTAGSIGSAVVVTVRDDLANKFAARNYSVG